MGLRSGTIVVIAVNVANKRAQFVHALKKVETPITCYADDHVFWPITFLKHALAPFEDPLVGLVGTVKRVERVKTGSFMERFLNYIAVIYLERHNFECTASYNLDGGVFVISGRTALTRTEIMHSVEFRQGFLNEKWWWGTVGPMKVDDDNFITRFMVNHGYKTVFHNEPAALMQTSLGVEGGFEKFRGQLIRWVRTTWRSNSTSLFAERKVWHAHPWTTYAMMISLFFNISLIYDPLLFYTLSRSGYLKEYGYALLGFLVVSKTIKQVPHLIRNPDDWPFWLANFLFVYFHSMLKIYAFFTAKNTAWTGRKDVDAKGDPEHEKGISCGGKGELRPKRPNRHNSMERVYDNGPWNNWNFVGIALQRTASSLSDVGQSLKRTASGLWGANEKESPSV
jgi:cellulose synthase/poly-beta-1,6-N-acetylglucosamine synthase-like glycosyltransferase